MRIFRSLVWFTPIIPLISIDDMIDIEISVIDFGKYIKTIIGAIFCQVNITKEFIQDRPSITSGNQKWNGAAPILVNIAESIISDKPILISVFLVIIIMIPIMNAVEARAWVMKYFIAASDSILFFVFLIRGIIDRRLISRPIHIIIQFLDEIVISEPVIVVNKNNVL